MVSLLDYIEEKKWDDVVTYTMTHPKESYWTDRYGRLPIHNALLEAAPLKVVSHLHTANPEGIRTKNKNGWLPIHQACSCGASIEVIKYG